MRPDRHESTDGAAGSSAVSEYHAWLILVPGERLCRRVEGDQRALGRDRQLRGTTARGERGAGDRGAARLCAVSSGDHGHTSSVSRSIIVAARVDGIIGCGVEQLVLNRDQVSGPATSSSTVNRSATTGRNRHACSASVIESRNATWPDATAPARSPHWSPTTRRSRARCTRRHTATPHTPAAAATNRPTNPRTRQPNQNDATQPSTPPRSVSRPRRQQTRGDPKRTPPHPPLDIINRLTAPQHLGERLGLGITGQLGVTRERQQRTPQTRVHGAIHRLHPILNPHTAHHHPYRAPTGRIR